MAVRSIDDACKTDKGGTNDTLRPKRCRRFFEAMWCVECIGQFLRLTSGRGRVANFIKLINRPYILRFSTPF